MFRTHQDLVRTPLKSKYNMDSFEGYKCDKCDTARYITETDVEIHKKAAHWDEINKEMIDHSERFCSACMSLQPSYSELISHIKYEHLLSSPTAKCVERDIFICQHCSHIFFNKGMMEVHIQYMHVYNTDKQRKSRTVECPKCQKKICLKSLWFHFQQHEIPSISACDICLTNFQSKQLLFEHVKTHPSVYKCVICNFNTTKEDLFNAHLADHKKKNYDRKKYVDNFIRRSFKRKVNPKFNIHNSLRGLYLPGVIDLCTICKEICTDKVEMKLHILRDHMGRIEEVKKRHMCACGQEFFNKVLLKQHVLKMKGFHRGLEEGEEPESLMNEDDIGEIVYQLSKDLNEIEENENNPVYVIETIDEPKDDVIIVNTDLQTEPMSVEHILGN